MVTFIPYRSFDFLDPVPTNDLEGRWEFTTDFLDTSGNGNNGTAQSGAAISGGVLVLGGTDDCIILPASNSIIADNANMTLCCWVNATNFSGDPSTFVANRAIGLTEGTGSSNVALGISNTGKVSAFARNATTATEILASTTISTATWYFIALVIDADEYTLYLNASSDSTPVTYSPTNNPGTYNASIGAYYGTSDTTRELTGSISRAKIYSRALTSTELTKIYNYESPNF